MRRSQTSGWMAALATVFMCTQFAVADPCNPNDADYDECMCEYNDPCECGYGDECECGWGDPCDCGYGDPCDCGGGDGCDCGWADPCDCPGAECDPSCGADPCSWECNGDPCDDPDSPCYDPCECTWCQYPECPDYDECYCFGGPLACNPACEEYDPYCTPDCPEYDPCMCPEADPCDCGWGDPCECGNGDPCECGYGDECECGWGDPCECGYGDPCECLTGDPCECGWETDPCICGGAAPCQCNDHCDQNCPGDFGDPPGTWDSQVDINDLLFLLGNYGGPGADIDGNGTTDIDDLLILFANFGPCPCEDICQPDCPEFDPCNTACSSFDPCNPECDTYDPCLPECPDYDYCQCKGWLDVIPDPNPCGDGLMPDCYGNCCPVDWATDNYCDDGSFTYNGVPIYLNCELFCFDGGMCDPCEPCDPNCGDYDPCDPVCDGGGPCNPACSDYDYCACRGWNDDLPDPPPCSDGEVPDCNGTCAPEYWVGDTYCDDGSYTWNGVPIYFNCDRYCYDLGDCN